MNAVPWKDTLMLREGIGRWSVLVAGHSLVSGQCVFTHDEIETVMAGSVAANSSVTVS